MASDALVAEIARAARELAAANKRVSEAKRALLRANKERAAARRAWKACQVALSEAVSGHSQALDDDPEIGALEAGEGVPLSFATDLAEVEARALDEGQEPAPTGPTCNAGRCLFAGQSRNSEPCSACVDRSRFTPNKLAVRLLVRIADQWHAEVEKSIPES